ncbi:MAG: MlaD family protein [Spartobacteria bacterium]
MSELPSSTTTPLRPVVKKARRLSPIWIIPIIAALLGLWLAWKYYAARGPEITVQFETAEGIIGGKTPVLCRSVNIGTVTAVQLTDDLQGVLVTMQMTSEATNLLKKDAQIWVVRPRYGSSGISGLSTIVSGSYIALEPGVAEASRREFVGLEQPPVTPRGVPGLHVTFFAEEAGGIAPGSPIIYKGLNAGRIETRVFHPKTGKVELGAFISSDYARLVRKNTKFWNVSGIDVEVGADGFHLRTGTIESLLVGGITFGQPEGAGSSPAVADGSVFMLYDSLSDTKKFVMQGSIPYLLLFSGSVRGLNEDAPVEFRGVRIGTVQGVSFTYLPENPLRQVPVLIQIDPSLIAADLPTDSTEPAEKFIDDAVRGGLRASLKTSSFLTGQLYVDLDFLKDPAPATVAELEGYRVLPTISSGLGELQEKVVAVLDKIQALPLDETVKNASAALDAIKGTAQSLDKTVGGYDQNGPLYQDLSQTLRQLDETLRSLRTLTGTLERKPNSIIFGKPGKVAPPKGSPP